MEPIAGSYRIRCRMSSSCLTYFVVPPSYPVRLPAVSSFPVACLLLACLVFSRFPICLVPPLYSPGGTIWRCASALFAITTIVWMSCDGRAAAGSSVRLRHACPSPRCSTRMAGRGADVVVACFFRISSAMREFCGSRYLRLPGLLRHGILSLCRRGRMSTVAAHRNSLACFSIPISAPIFASSPSSTPIAV